MSGTPGRRPVTVRFKSRDFSFKVKPGYLRVAHAYGESNTIVVVNDTDLKVEFEFPDGLMKTPAGGAVSKLTLAKKGDTADLDVNPDYGGGAPSVVVEYDVCVYLAGNLCLSASGGSRPEVEIRR